LEEIRGGKLREIAGLIAFALGLIFGSLPLGASPLSLQECAIDLADPNLLTLGRLTSNSGLLERAPHIETAEDFLHWNFSQVGEILKKTSTLAALDQRDAKTSKLQIALRGSVQMYFLETSDVLKGLSDNAFDSLVNLWIDERFAHQKCLPGCSDKAPYHSVAEMKSALKKVHPQEHNDPQKITNIYANAYATVLLTIYLFDQKFPLGSVSLENMSSILPTVYPALLLREVMMRYVLKVSYGIEANRDRRTGDEKDAVIEFIPQYFERKDKKFQTFIEAVATAPAVATQSH